MGAGHGRRRAGPDAAPQRTGQAAGDRGRPPPPPCATRASAGARGRRCHAAAGRAGGKPPPPPRARGEEPERGGGSAGPPQPRGWPAERQARTTTEPPDGGPRRPGEPAGARTERPRAYRWTFRRWSLRRNTGPRTGGTLHHRPSLRGPVRYVNLTTALSCRPGRYGVSGGPYRRPGQPPAENVPADCPAAHAPTLQAARATPCKGPASWARRRRRPARRARRGGAAWLICSRTG